MAFFVFANSQKRNSLSNRVTFFDQPHGSQALHRDERAGQIKVRATRETTMNQDQLLNTLKNLLREVLDTRFEGAAYAKLARAHGYADGYMRALLDSGLMTQGELLEFVGQERRAFLDKKSVAA